MNEIWRDIEGYEGYYQVSNFGNIRSLDRVVKCRCGYRIAKGKNIITSYLNKSNYIQVDLSKNSKVKTFTVHRLVAQAFIPNPNNLPCVNHKDENPSNNCVENLEWCTHKYNSNYGNNPSKHSAIMYDRYKNPNTLKQFERIWKNNQAKRRKKVCQLSMDNKLIKVWDSTYEADAYGYYHTHIGGCANGYRKTHKGCKWVWYEDYIKREGGDNSPVTNNFADINI